MEQPNEPSQADAGSLEKPALRPGLLASVAQAIRFYSRIPFPRLPGETSAHAPPDISMLPKALPFASIAIVAPACATVFIADIIGFPAFISAALTLVVLLLSTGAFHEDGLADVSDGFGGGATLARKLDIMRDSRVGTYGAAAVCLSLLLRIAALSTLIETRPRLEVAALLIAVGALSRMAGLIPLALLPSARADGVSKDFGRPDMKSLAIGFLIAAALTAALSAIVNWPLALGVALIFAAAAGGLLMTLIARRQIGGQTGDVAGAAQQIAEIACLLVPLATGFAR